MQNSSRLPGFSPLQDSVSEIRVDVFQSDASYGDTSNGTINLITKSGGNRIHGTLSEFNEFSALNAPVRWFQSPTVRQPATRHLRGNPVTGHCRRCTRDAGRRCGRAACDSQDRRRNCDGPG